MLFVAPVFPPSSRHHLRNLSRWQPREPLPVATPIASEQPVYLIRHVNRGRTEGALSTSGDAQAQNRRLCQTPLRQMRREEKDAMPETSHVVRSQMTGCTIPLSRPGGCPSPLSHPLRRPPIPPPLPPPPPPSSRFPSSSTPKPPPPSRAQVHRNQPQPCCLRPP